MKGQHAGARPPLAFNPEAAEVYGVNTVIAIVMVLMSWLSLPPGSHTVQETLWGGSVVVALSWVVAFLVAGLPFHRARPEEHLTSQ